MTKDILPNGLSNLSSGLIGKRSMRAKPRRGISDHKSGKGVKAFSSRPISRQWYTFDLVAELLVGESYGWWSDGSIGRKTSAAGNISGGHLINFHRQSLCTWLHITRVMTRVRRTETDSLKTFSMFMKNHVLPTDHTQFQLRTTASCLVKLEAWVCHREPTQYQQRTTASCLVKQLALLRHKELQRSVGS